MDKSELLQRIGDISQLCDAKRYRSISGRDDGNIYIQVYVITSYSIHYTKLYEPVIVIFSAGTVF